MHGAGRASRQVRGHVSGNFLKGRLTGQWQARIMTYLAAADRYDDKMPYQRTGRSDLKLPAVSLGLRQNFGDDRPLETHRAILRRASDLGVTHFNLASN